MVIQTLWENLMALHLDLEIVKIVIPIPPQMAMNLDYGTVMLMSREIELSQK